MTSPLPLLDVLQQRFPDSSKTSLRKMLQTGRVRVNGEPERDARRVVVSRDRVDVASKAAGQSLDPRVSILYEDEDLIVIDKAAGLLTVASPAEKEETAEAFLNAYLQAMPRETRIHVVHRLDRDSSGVLVFARDPDMRERLKALFAAHDIDRIYVAIVHGTLPEPAGTFRSFLIEDRCLRVKSAAGALKGREAITHYRTIRSGHRYSMLEVTLETGRRNQIRVHLAEARHPIVGDTMYGKKAVDPLGRLALHAKHLGFVHPGTGKKMVFTVPVPAAFLELHL